MKIILVCGATGFIGRNLVEFLSLNPHYQVFAISHLRQPYNTPLAINPVHWITVDLRDPFQLERIPKKIDVVIQAAATTSGSKDIISQPYIHVTDNAVMNSLLLRALYERDIGQIIFFSCSIVYQYTLPTNKPVKESDYSPSGPIYPKYFGAASTKLYIESMMRFYSDICSTKMTVIRHSNIYGPHDKFDLDRSHVFGASITKVLTSLDTIEIWGDGSDSRDFLHVNDLVRFVDLSIKHQQHKFQIYNCGSGILLSVSQLIEHILAISGKSLSVTFNTNKPSISTGYALDCQLANRDLGWSPTVDLNDGIESTISWWIANMTGANLSPSA